MVKALLANLSILATLVSYVYFQRNASENGDFLATPNKILAAVNPTRLLASSTQNYSAEVCPNTTAVDYNKSQAYNGKMNAALFGSYRSNYLEADIMSKAGGSEDYKDYGISFIPLVAPWFILWILGIIINVCLSCNQCCMVGCCKNCCSCCGCCKKPKVDRKICRLVSGFMAILCALGAVGAAAGGLIVSQSITDDYRQTRCAFFQAMDAIEYGNSSAGWMGISSTYYYISQLDSMFTNTFTNSPTYDPTSSLATLSTSSNTLNTDLGATYTAHSSDTTVSANPSNGGTQVKPDIITNLGPLTTITSWLGAINNEQANKTATATSAADSLNTNYNAIKNSIPSYQSNIDSGLNDVQGLNNLFTDMESNTYSYTQTGDDIVSGYVKKALIGIFAGGLGIAVLTLICPLCVCVFQKKFCNSCIFVAWESFSLVMLLGFVIGIISLIVGIVVTQGCDVMYQSLTVSGYLNNVTAFISTDSSYTKYINTCLFGSGNLVDQIGVTNTFDTLNNIESAILVAKPLFRSTNGGDSTTIPPFTDALSKTIKGTYLLIASSSNQDGTAYNLAILNSNSNDNTPGSPLLSTYGCPANILQDQWVFDTTNNCTYSPVWTSPPDTDITGLGSQICIGVDSTIDSTTTSTGRYQSSTFTSCSSFPGNTLSSYRTALKNHFDGANTKMTTLQGSVTGTITTDYGTFEAALYSVTDPIETINGNISPILTLISDPNTGLINNLNCSFFKASLKTFNYAMCDGLVYTFYQITLAMLIMATFACIGSIFQFCFAKYMRTVLENKESNEKNPYRT